MTERIGDRLFTIADAVEPVLVVVGAHFVLVGFVELFLGNLRPLPVECAGLAVAVDKDRAFLTGEGDTVAGVVADGHFDIAVLLCVE